MRIKTVMVFLVSTSLFAATFTVTNINDSGAGSLRDAVNLANTTAGPDTVDFTIPGSGVHTIRPLSPLPAITDPAGVFINGLTQTGAATGSNPPQTATLMIEINGSNAGTAHGFRILSSNNTIQGVVIDSFLQDGIRIQGTQAGTSKNYIFSNLIGTDPTGVIAQGNGRNQPNYWAGVSIIVTPEAPGFAFDNRVEANLISGNYTEGVSISNCPPGRVHHNLVLKNYIGTDITGTTDLGNFNDGVYIGEGTDSNTVENNLIAGNDQDGVGIVGYYVNSIYTNDNIVKNNIIGADINLAPLPNSGHGVCIGQYRKSTIPNNGFACGNQIGPGNTIAYNDSNGVNVWEHPKDSTNADRNRITRNSIYDNGLLGIDLQNDSITPNDPGDLDKRANQELNFPVIDSALLNIGTAIFLVVLGSAPPHCTVEVFTAQTDPSGYGEGKVFLDSDTADALGKFHIWIGLSGGLPDKITATATDANGNTSEFSACKDVTVIGLAENNFLPNLSVRIYPSLMKSHTAINYELPSATSVSLKIYDICGSLVTMLVNEKKDAGFHQVTWNGHNERSKPVASGIYFCELQAAGIILTQKLILIR